MHKSKKSRSQRGPKAGTIQRLISKSPYGDSVWLCLGIYMFYVELCIFLNKYRHLTHIYEYFVAPAAYPAPTHPSAEEAAFGRLHKGGRAAFGRPPPFVDSFKDRCLGNE